MSGDDDPHDPGWWRPVRNHEKPPPTPTGGIAFTVGVVIVLLVAVLLIGNSLVSIVRSPGASD
jgi:hypothetical protein